MKIAKKVIAMKKKILLAAGIIVALVLLANFFFLSRYSCSVLIKKEATLTVKIIPGRGMLGLNTDMDALKFGVVSPGIAVMRKVNVQHSRGASVRARMEGELGRWTSISPPEFELSAGETKEVAFEVNVPTYALPGNYSGTAVFCIKER